MNEDLKNKIEEFQKNKTGWVELGPLLIDIKYFDEYHTLINPRTLQSMLKSYLFLKNRFPEWAKNPNEISHYTVSYLLFIEMLLKKRGRETEFKDIVAKTLNGTMDADAIRKLSKELSGKDVKPSSSPAPVKSTEEEAIIGMLNAIDYLLDTTKTPMKQLREKVGERCYNTANKLQCVADEEFAELWKTKKEFTI
jgi:hypothetical protein